VYGAIFTALPVMQMPIIVLPAIVVERILLFFTLTRRQDILVASKHALQDISLILPLAPVIFAIRPALPAKTQQLTASNVSQAMDGTTTSAISHAISGFIIPTTILIAHSVLYYAQSVLMLLFVQPVTSTDQI
jgi:hypothetical protein